MAFISLNSSDYIDKINSLVKPEYESKYNDTISQLMDKIANKEKFSYDFNADPLYQNYKDNYVKLGNEAAMNAAASVSGLTGGYGNSYAATAASQANQQYLTQLNNVIPELYNAAMNKYKMEVEDMYNQFGMYQTEEQRLYGQHRDNVSDYYSDWSNLQQGFGTALSHEEFLESMGYQKERDAVADSQWERNFQLDAQKAAAKGGSGSGSTTSGTTSNNSASGSYVSAYTQAIDKINHGTSSEDVAKWLVSAANSGQISETQAAQIYNDVLAAENKKKTSKNTNASNSTINANKNLNSYR